jgi:hypothetical protein
LSDRFRVLRLALELIEYGRRARSACVIWRDLRSDFSNCCNWLVS